MIPCSRCPSTATHYPRVYFIRGQTRMGVFLKKPVCAEHRIPIVESFLNRHEIAVYSALYQARREDGALPDATRTRIEFVPRVENEASLERSWELMREAGKVNAEEVWEIEREEATGQASVLV